MVKLTISMAMFKFANCKRLYQRVGWKIGRGCPIIVFPPPGSTRPSLPWNWRDSLAWPAETFRVCELENHHLYQIDQRFLWPCSIMFNIYFDITRAPKLGKFMKKPHEMSCKSKFSHISPLKESCFQQPCNVPVQSPNMVRVATSKHESHQSEASQIPPPWIPWISLPHVPLHHVLAADAIKFTMFSNRKAIELGRAARTRLAPRLPSRPWTPAKHQTSEVGDPRLPPQHLGSDSRKPILVGLRHRSSIKISNPTMKKKLLSIQTQRFHSFSTLEAPDLWDVECDIFYHKSPCSWLSPRLPTQSSRCSPNSQGASNLPENTLWLCLEIGSTML